MTAALGASGLYPEKARAPRDSSGNFNAVLPFYQNYSSAAVSLLAGSTMATDFAAATR